MSQTLNKVIDAIARSVVHAESLVRRAHLQALRQYFDENHKPIGVDLQVPSTRPGVPSGTMDTLHVPLLALVHHRQMSIEDVEVEFAVELGDLGIDEATGGASPEVSNQQASDAQAVDWNKGAAGDATMAVGLHGHAQPGTGLASIKLKLRAEPLPEGVARLQDRLSKTLS